jgi:hypothetical protein
LNPWITNTVKWTSNTNWLQPIIFFPFVSWLLPIIAIALF